MRGRAFGIALADGASVEAYGADRFGNAFGRTLIIGRIMQGGKGAQT